MSEKVHYLIKEETLQEIAQAVRNKTNETGEIVVSELADKINNIESGGGLDTSDATAAAADILAGKTAYVDGEKITGTFTIDNELTTQDDLISQIQAAADSLPEASGDKEISLQDKIVTPTTSSQVITADSGYDGLDIVTVNAIPSTYIKPTATKSATTYTPTTSDQTITAGTYCSGVQTIKGDANLIPANIVSGKSIFGVAGTATSGGGEEGGIKTCTLLISGELGFAYNEVINGEIFARYVESPNNCEVKVPCSSLITVRDYMFMGMYSPKTIQGITTVYDGALTTNLDLVSVFQVSSAVNNNCILSF